MLSLDTSLNPGIFANPYPLYHQLRSQFPIHLDERLGCWVVTSYADVLSALANRDLSSERTKRGPILQEKEWSVLTPLFSYLSDLMFYADPPKHTRIRALMNKAFSSRMIEKWRAHIQRIVDYQLDLVQDQRKMDVIQDLAFPLPARVIADMLGIPSHDQAQFKSWSDDLAGFLGNPPTLDQCDRLLRSMQEFMDYFRAIVVRHRTSPEDDLVDALLQAEDQEGILTEDELLVNCVGLFAGGHETTTNLIGNGLFALLNNPQEMQQLTNDFSLINSSVEEFLRYDSPVQFVARVVRQTTKLGTKKIFKGQSVMLMIGAANRDPHRFTAPDQLDIRRQDNRHLAFGHNIHFCIGSALARLEAQIAIETILRRMPALQLAPVPLTWRENLAFHGLKSLPVTF